MRVRAYRSPDSSLVCEWAISKEWGKERDQKRAAVLLVIDHCQRRLLS